MPDNKTNNNLGSFSDINDEIIIKKNGDFKIFSHGSLSDLDLSKLKEKIELSQETQVLDTGMEEQVLAPPAPMVWDKKSSFYFDTEDEDEVAKEKKKIEKIGQVGVKKYSLNKIIEKITENYNLNLVSQLENRLHNIVLSFFKHTRTKVDILNLFKFPINQSGLALDANISNRLIDLLVSIRDKIDSVGGIVVEDRFNGEIDRTEGLDREKVESLANMDPRQAIKMETKSFSMPMVRRTGILYGKPKIAGIKKQERVISPVEELGEITLTTFRRLSDDPVEAVQKIMGKIKVFEKESYLKKAMAIKYWRQSEVYKLYLDLGRASMEKDLSIDKVIEQKILAKEKVLTMEEFKAVSDLNKKLRF